MGDGLVRSNSAALAARLARFSFLICFGCFFANCAAELWKLHFEATSNEVRQAYKVIRVTESRHFKYI